MPRLNNRKGQGLIEYILVVVLMAVVSIGLVRNLQTKTDHGFNKAINALGQEFDR
jgi:Flp pilus assembly pilin Flp